MSRSVVAVPLPTAPYEILIEPGLLDAAGEPIAAVLPPRGASTAGRARRLVVVTDENVGPLYLERLSRSLSGAGYEVRSAVVPPGEGQKTLERAAWLYRRFLDAEIDRGDAIVALGGGVVGDLAGFAAATFLRGVPYVQVPTTLLAQVDSSVGGKTGVDHERGKNLIGAFHQPRAVIIDPQTLRTLPEREYRAGLAEVVKYGVIADAELFARIEERGADVLALEPELLTEIIATCCRIKAEVVLADERETSGRRMILNFGHTIGHALEAEAETWGLRHGEAIAVGMVLACRLAEQTLDFAETGRVRELLSRFSLPASAPELRAAGFGPFDPEGLLGRMAADKKVRAGKIRWVLPGCLGGVRITDEVDPELVRQMIEEDFPPLPQKAKKTKKEQSGKKSGSRRGAKG